MRRIAYVFVWLFAASIPVQELGASIFVDVTGTLSRVIGVAAAITAFMALIYEGRLRPFSVVHGIIILFLAWGGFSFLWSVDQAQTYARLVTNVQLAIMIILFCQFGSSKEENHGLIRAYVIGASISLIELFRTYALGLVFAAGEHAERYSAYDNNPNDYALALVLGIPMAWYLVMKGRKNWEVFLGYVYTGMASVGVILTGSRGGLVACCVALMILPMSLFRLTRTKKMLTIASIFVAFIVGIRITPELVWTRLMTLEELAPSNIPETYYGELEGPNIRTVIWKQGMNEFLSNPQVAVAGVGAGAYQAGVEPLYGERYVAHNAYISILVEQGIIGLALFLVILYLVLSPVSYLETAERYLWRFAFLAWAVGVTFITWEHTKNTWFLIGLLAARVVTAKANSQRKPSLISSLFMRGGLRLHTR